MEIPHIYPWYDSVWLQSFRQARGLVHRHYPNRLEEFDAAFECLKTNPRYRTKRVDSVFSESRFGEIKEFLAQRTSAELEKQELLNFGRTVMHNQSLFDQLQQELTPLVSELAGEALEPSYNFLSLYNNLGVCELHMDAPNAKWTLDICIEQSAQWPIYIAEPGPWPELKEYGQGWAQQVKQQATFHEHILQPNSAILFSGSSQWHYRNRIAQMQKNNYCHLLFFHYFPVGAREILKPQNWAKIFSMPELAAVQHTSSEISYNFEF